MNTIRRMFHLLSYNFKTLVTFEFFFKVITAALILPASNGILSLVFRVTGYKYITAENINKFLRNPLTLLCVFVILLIITLYSLIDIGTVIYILDQSAQDHKTSVRVSFLYSVKKSLRMFLPQNLLMVFLVMLTVPYMHLGFTAAWWSTISIPDLLEEEVFSHRNYTALFIAGVILLGALLLRWIYIFHYYELEKCNSFSAARRSARLSKKHHIADALSILVTQAILAIFFYGATLGGIAIITFAKKVCDSLGIVGVVLSSIIVVFLMVMLVVLFAISLPVSFAMISILFYRRKDQRGEEVQHTRKIERREKTKKELRRSHIIWTTIVIAALVACGYWIYGTSHGKLSLDIEQVHMTEVSAHRGSSANYPENTMAAFAAAYQQGADWIELDIQQSKDGVLFVMHDSSFKRTTGVRKKAWELTWEEIQELDAGSYKGEQFEGEQIPSLEEVIQFAKLTGMRLNIELKPTGHETDFEKSVVEMIEEYNFVDQCVVTSQNYEAIQNVKAENEEIRTVYVMGVAVGNIAALKDADDFSIRSSFITQRLVDNLHNKGHRVYAWTVNSSDAIDRMVNMGVDNIITNDVPLAKDRIAKSRVTNVVDDLIAFLQTL